MRILITGGAGFIGSHLAEALLDALISLETDLTLVLDDYHTIQSQAVHTIITRIVPHLPDLVKLVITTRSAPPMPLSLWHVRHWVTEIGAVELRFSNDGALRFL